MHEAYVDRYLLESSPPSFHVGQLHGRAELHLRTASEETASSFEPERLGPEEFFAQAGRSGSGFFSVSTMRRR